MWQHVSRSRGTDGEDHTRRCTGNPLPLTEKGLEAWRGGRRGAEARARGAAAGTCAPIPDLQSESDCADSSVRGLMHVSVGAPLAPPAVRVQGASR